MGLTAARSGVSGDIPHGRIQDHHLAVPLAGVPLCVHVGHREAGVGRSDLARLTAAQYHFWTQPLPTPLAWYAAQAPSWLLIAGTAAALGVELGAVFLIFLPRRLRAAAAACILLLQCLITLTGNYNFFNLLTMLMCLPLFDDAALRRCVPRRAGSGRKDMRCSPGREATAAAAVLAPRPWCLSA